ncbi:hypothetical protein FAZ69_32195 [Trinickia terrae]|uniref:Cellulose synthase operon C C-terminal domain-containing protein n=1 Tax=Trinickia terrae TaxID=2571161 RepID=A0A4U1HFW7_9BURK|nr:cellulose synthase subunit BcsC-related outer membrane protein [Trinickia terrae]TKC78084.1 hypothetical protein FAZ69_32195 [Trinickia terrae]
MPARRTERRRRLALGGWRWGVVWLSIALPGLALAAQDNVLSIGRSASPVEAASRAVTQGAASAGQRALTSERVQAGGVRVRQDEQQGFVVPSLASSPATGGGAKAAAAGVVAPPAAPDERPLWNLLKASQLAAYDAEVTRLTGQFALWKPGAALAAERERRQREQDVAAALKGGPDALRSMIARAPGEFGCAHIDRAWKAADVFAHAGDRDAVVSLYRTIVPSCQPAGNRIATLYLAERQVSAAQVDDLIRVEAEEGKRGPEADAAFARLRYQRALSALGALPPGDPAAAMQLAALAAGIRAYRDAPAATQAGWIEFAQHRLDAAAGWFETALTFEPQSVDGAIGLAQIRVGQRDWDAAQALLSREQVAADPRAKDLLGQIALARADEAYRARRYAESLGDLGLAASLGVPEANTGALRGWNLYALHRYGEAERAFRARYDASRDDDSAEGLALSLVAEGKPVAPHDGGPLGAYGHALEAQRLYYRKSFVAAQAELRDAQQGPADAARIARYVPADLTGIDAASVSAGLTWSDHVGSAGQGRLNVLAPAVRAEWIDGTRQYELRYRQLFLNDGVTSARAEELQTMMADTLRLGGDRALDWRASLGAAQGSPVGATVDGQARIGQQAAWGAWSVYAGVNPVRDSLLSWRGQMLSDDGYKWGAVRRAASGAQARWQISPRWSIGAAAEAQWLTGMNVVGNEGASADVSAGYAFDVPGFDYFSAGPAVHVLGYRRNENFYTPGQGGYYSPQRSISEGLALQMLSKEGRTWQWQGNFEAGWNDSLQANEPCLPLGLPPGESASRFPETCTGGHDHGPYAHAQVSATVKLSSRVQAGALADVNVTPGRDKQFAALAFVRFFFEPRAAVFSRDLARNTRDFYLQLDDDHP